jgi:hypothetical protein
MEDSTTLEGFGKYSKIKEGSKGQYEWVKTHYTIHKMLSQSSFCKICKFVIGHVIKYS